MGGDCVAVSYDNRGGGGDLVSSRGSGASDHELTLGKINAVWLGEPVCSVLVSYATQRDPTSVSIVIMLTTLMSLNFKSFVPSWCSFPCSFA